jgi:hypothetical protein
MKIRNLALCSLGLVAACGNNVASLFNRGRGGGGPGDESGIVLVGALGKLVDTRPRVVEAFPQSGGWPTTVPILIVFNESISRDSVEPPTTGGGPPTPPRITLRAQGTTQSLPVLIDYLFGDTAVLLRPATALPATATFEVVVAPDVTDLDGVTKGGADQIVATFRADQADTLDDGRILATLPAANAREVYRESEFLVVFDRPADTASVSDTNLFLRAGGTPIDAEISTPVRTQGVADPRIFRIQPDDPLAGALAHELVVADSITFENGVGNLDFGNRTPFLEFRTVAFAPPTRVSIGNAPAGFPDKINAQSLANATVEVEVDASAPAGARVDLRVYGLDPETQATGDIFFFDSSLSLPAAGPTTISFPIGTVLGTAADLRFEEGPLVLVAQVVQGDASSSFTTTADGSTDPRIDVTPPTFAGFLPPVANAPNDVAIDHDFLTLLGRASERIGSAELTDGTRTVALWSAAADGAFMMRPIGTPRSGLPASLTLSLTDLAGNVSTTTQGARVLRRGYAVGTQSGRLSVEVYDDATLAPIAGATVVVESAQPQNPAVGRRIEVTGVDGRAVFDGLTLARVTITAIAADHHLLSLVDTPAAEVSLPLIPTGAAASATLSGQLAFIPVAGQSARIGINTLLDPLAFEVAPSPSALTTIPSTPIRAGRATLFSAYVGSFEPVATPTFASFNCAICGPTGAGTAVPLLPASGTGTVQTTQAVVASTGLVGGLLGPYAVDFALATGLGAVDGPVVVRPVATFGGFAGAMLLGAGFATLVANATYSINANWPLASIGAIGPLGPVLWIQSQARDASGNTSIHRALLSNATLGFVFDTGAPLGVPTITAPAGPSNDSPAITFADRLDASLLPGGFGFHTLELEDASARRWYLVQQDFDGAGGQRTLQVPLRAGMGVAALADGGWQVRASSELMFGTDVADGQFTFEERYRQMVKASRTSKMEFTVQ